VKSYSGREARPTIFQKQPDPSMCNRPHYGRYTPGRCGGFSGVAMKLPAYAEAQKMAIRMKYFCLLSIIFIYNNRNNKKQKIFEIFWIHQKKIVPLQAKYFRNINGRGYCFDK
jgi:hypothetical protein